MNYLKRIHCFLLIIGMLTLPMVGAHANTPDQCTRAEPVPVFAEKQDGIRLHKFVSISNHEANESFQLNSGETVEIRHWGCEYFVTSFRIESPRILKGGKSLVVAYKFAANLLRRLQQLHADSSFDLVLAAGALEAAARNNSVIKLEQEIAVEGDGTDFLQANIQIDDVGRKEGIGFIQTTLSRGPL